MKTKSRIVIGVVAAIVILAGYFGVRAGLEGKDDPLWHRLDTVLVANNLPCVNLKISDINNDILTKFRFKSISESLDKVDSIYKSLQKDADSVKPLNSFFGKPFMPSWEYDKLLMFLNPLLKSHSIVISGVTGSGKTTIVDRLAMMISGNQARIHSLQCVENMDVEYHKEWVGSRIAGRLYEGKILRLFRQCADEPNDKFVLVLDDFDKIYPSTFFGSEIWSEMDNPADSNYIDGWGEVTIPKNFYLICVTHIGVGNVIEFNDEHFRRLGEEKHIRPDVNEMIIYFREQNEKGKLKLDPEQLKKVLYFFSSANEYISTKYGDSYALGQWSTIRKNLKPEKWQNFIDCFITHVNAFKPAEDLHEDDFRPILYTIGTDGKVMNSNFFWWMYKELLDTGIFSELTVGIGFAILSGLFGWFVIFRRRNFIKDLHVALLSLVDQFKTGSLSHDQALEGIIRKKQEIEDLILNRKIRYEEVTYLLMFINDQLKVIDDINKTRQISGDFYAIFDEYARDGVIDESEYIKLTRFLDNIRSALNPEVYYTIKSKIESMRNKE